MLAFFRALPLSNPRCFAAAPVGHTLFHYVPEGCRRYSTFENTRVTRVFSKVSLPLWAQPLKRTSGLRPSNLPTFCRDADIFHSRAILATDNLPTTSPTKFASRAFEIVSREEGYFVVYQSV